MILHPFRSTRLRTLLKTLFVFSLIGIAPNTEGAGIELHAHLFMKKGMTWLFHGGFHEPLQAHDWRSRLSSQVNPEALERSKLDLVVATLYAHPFLTLSLRDSIRNQIQELKLFLREHPNWILAKTPSEAQEGLRAGKKIFLLALEGGSGILETEEDLREFVDQEGIRIVTFLHLTDDHWGGVAFLKGFRALASPWAFFMSLIHPDFQPLEGGSRVRLNRQGLTPQGRQALTRLLKHRVWIDFTHASDASQEEMRTQLPHSQYPILYTHTVLRRFHKAERGLSEAQLNTVAQSHGYLGLIPSEEFLENTPSPSPQCQGGILAFAHQYQLLASVLGESSIATGSDYNGGITHLRPLQHCHTVHTAFTENDKGFWEIGQSLTLWKTLQELGVWHPQTSLLEEDHTHVETFISTWARAWQSMSP
jgi:microsomal dipeptidase-like Zn-dependent dipeptidase